MTFTGSVEIENMGDAINRKHSGRNKRSEIRLQDTIYFQFMEQFAKILNLCHFQGNR